MGVRTLIFWTHLAVGVSVGLVVASLALSGLVLAFEPQIVHWAEREVREVAVPTGGVGRMDTRALLEAVRKDRPEARPASVTLYSDPAAAAVVGLGRKSAVYVNPYTGTVLGRGSRVGAAMQTVEDWHRRLALGDTGQAITGAASAGFAFMLGSGLFLWWPREWTRAALGAVALFRPGLKGKARDFNWHNVIGLWSAPLVLATTLTGLVMSYSWANGILFRMAGSSPPPPRTERGRDRGEAPVAPPNLDALVARAGQQAPGWTSMTLRFASKAEAPLTVSIEEPPQGLFTPRSQLTLDPTNAAVVQWEPFAGQDAGRRVRSLIVPLHTGRIAGPFGQAFAFASASGASVLVWTGLAMAWRRFRAWRARRRPLPGRTVVSSRSLSLEEEGGVS